MRSVSQKQQTASERPSSSSNPPSAGGLSKQSGALVKAESPFKPQSKTLVMGKNSKMRKEDLSHTLTKFAPLLNSKNQNFPHPEPVVKKIDGCLQLCSRTMEQNKLDSKLAKISFNSKLNNENGSQIQKSEIYRRNSSNSRQPSVVRTNGLLNTNGRASIHKDPPTQKKSLGLADSPIAKKIILPDALKNKEQPLSVRVKVCEETDNKSETRTQNEQAATPSTATPAHSNMIVPKGIDMAAVLRSPKPGFFVQSYNENERAIITFHASSNYSALSDSARQTGSYLMKPLVVYDSVLPPNAFSKINNMPSSAPSDSDNNPTPITEGIISTSVNKIMQPNPSSLSAMVDRLITAQLQSQNGGVSATNIRKAVTNPSKRSISCQNQKVVPPKTPFPVTLDTQPPIQTFYNLKDKENDDTLIFESRFESANLRRVIQTEKYSYDLILNPDIGTGNHTQWYYFRVTNPRANRNYNFNIVNLLKPDSLFNEGLRPLIYSVKAAEATGTGWKRAGEKISYFQNGIPKNGGSRTDPILASAQALLTNGSEPKQFINNPALREYGGTNFYTLKFTMSFDYDNDQVYISHAFPYPYSLLKHNLAQILANRSHQRDRIRRSLLCKTIAGNELDLLIITNFTSSHLDIAVRKAIILTARVHPGETGGSWMMQGVLEFLISDAPEAVWLRNKYVFKLVPMLNPDGVVLGNTRCSLSGKDLNRCWGIPSSRMHPQIFHTKQMIRITLESREIEMFCDLHSHSRKTNAFFYGCTVGGNNENHWLEQRIIPFLLSNRTDSVSYSDCSFMIHKGRQTCGRVVVRKEFNVINSYTLEASFLGSSLGVRRDCHFTPTSLKAIGSNFMLVLKDINDKFIYERTLNELLSIHGQAPGITRPAEFQADGEEVSRDDKSAKDYSKLKGVEESKRSLWAIKGTAVNALKPRLVAKAVIRSPGGVNYQAAAKKRKQALEQTKLQEALKAGEGAREQKRNIKP